MLVLKDIYKTYNLGKTNVNALNGISLSIKKGEFVSIMGPSGSGKTTLLNIMGSLDHPTNGKVYVNGKDTSKMDDSELTRLRRHEIGFIFQFFNLIPVLTSYENIELPLIVIGMEKDQRKKRVLELLERMEIEHRAGHKPDELSGGERQRVAIARALANRPSIILADEITGDLDSKTGEKIIDLIIELNRSENQSFVIITHDLKVAESTSLIYNIEDGKLI
ncbi:MAG: ABC transporter ATP-binding protein [Candidatus Lokiarchaeota archaeon]|nr:ABC transporter ATP-binding protein [Candidatus Lokiarchaeota archaeon]